MVEKKATLSPADTRQMKRVCVALRQLQWKTKTSDSDRQLAATLDLMKEIGDLLRSGAKLSNKIKINADDPSIRKEVMYFVICVFCYLCTKAYSFLIN